MKILFVQIPYKKNASGGSIVSERNKRLLEKYFGAENVICPLSFNLGLSRKNLNPSKTIQKIIDKLEIDIVFLDSSCIGILGKSFYGKNTVFCFFHNVEISYAQQEIKSMSLSVFKNFKLFIILKWFVPLFEKYCVNYSYKLISLNKRDSKELKKIYGREADYILGTSMEDQYTKRKIGKINSKPYILFVGTDFYGNTDGLFPFIEEAMPQINCNLITVGRGMDKYADKYPPKYKTKFLGFVDDLQELYRNAELVVLPIISGSGMKTKTCEALMYGKKIFGTKEAFEGYHWLDENDCVVCKNNQEFVQKINNYLRKGSPSWSEANRRTFLEHYSDSAVEKGFFDFMTNALKYIP